MCRSEASFDLLPSVIYWVPIHVAAGSGGCWGFHRYMSRKGLILLPMKSDENDVTNREKQGNDLSIPLPTLLRSSWCFWRTFTGGAARRFPCAEIPPVEKSLTCGVWDANFTDKFLADTFKNRPLISFISYGLLPGSGNNAQHNPFIHDYLHHIYSEFRPFCRGSRKCRIRHQILLLLITLIQR